MQLNAVIVIFFVVGGWRLSSDSQASLQTSTKPHKLNAIKSFSLSLCRNFWHNPHQSWSSERKTINILRRIRSNEMHYCLLSRICDIKKHRTALPKLFGLKQNEPKKKGFYDVKFFTRRKSPHNIHGFYSLGCDPKCRKLKASVSNKSIITALWNCFQASSAAALDIV